MAEKDANLASDPGAVGELFLTGEDAQLIIEVDGTPVRADFELLIVQDTAMFEIELSETPSQSSGSASFPAKQSTQKSQFISTEPLDVLLSPFLGTSGEYITTGIDVITLTLKAPDATIYNPTAVWDSDVSMWVAQLLSTEFQEGEWLLYGASSVSGSLPQFSTLWWGDYVDDIPETRQAALGRWKIEGTTLRLYEEDGTTVFKEFALKDSAGNPSGTVVFEKDPI